MATADWRNWRQGAGVAASASSVPAWQRYLQGFGGGSAGVTAGMDDDEANLQRALTSYGNRQAEAQALGVDDTGEAAPGLLTRSLRGLDWLRAAAFNTVREGVDLATGGDASLRDLRENIDRREGFGDLEALRMQDDDPMWERVLKGGAAFVGDVATDPLTYVTFGGAAVGKRAASEIVESGARAFARDLDDSVLERFAQRSAPQRAVDLTREQLGDAAADELAETALRRGRAASSMDEAGEGLGELADLQTRRALGVDQFGGEAMAAYQAGGSTGLRRFLVSELGEEAGERAFRALPRDVQGGINLRAPLARRTLEDGSRTTVAAGLGGGGRTLEALGLDGLALRGTRARNAMRASRLGRRVADALGGADGRLYGQVVADMVAGRGDEVGGHTWQMYAATRRARMAAGRAAQQLHTDTAQTVASMDRLVREVEDGDAARRVRDELFRDPARLRRLLAAADGQDAEAAVEWEALSPAERAGVAAAKMGQDYLARQHEQLLAMGVDVGTIRDYVPLILTSESRLSRQVRKPVRPSQGRRGGMGGYDQTKEARQFWVPELADDGTVTGWRRLSPDQVNERQAAREAAGTATNPGDVYEVDPLRMVAEYGDAVRKLTQRLTFARALNDAGVVFQGGTEGASSVVAARLRDAQQTVAQTDAEWRAALGNQATPPAAAVGDAADQVAPEAPRVRQAFDEVFADIPASARERVWQRTFGDTAERVVLPTGGMEARIREVVRRAGWRPDGNESGRAVFVAPPEQLRAARQEGAETARGAAQALAELPPVPEGHVRLFRGETDPETFRRATQGMTPEQREALFPESQRGRWFTDDVDYVLERAQGDPERVRYLDVPAERARQMIGEGASPNAQNVTEYLVDDDSLLDAAVKLADQVDPLTARLDDIARQKGALDRQVAALVDLPPAQQLARIDALMDGMVDFVARAYDDLTGMASDTPEWKARVAEAERRLTAARKARREAVQTGSRLNEPSFRLARDTGLRQVGAPDPSRPGLADVRLPAEMDVTFAPDVLAETIERYYRVSRTESKQFAEFIDATYRPYLNFFKTTATVGRGYGYDARNVMGGIWNNWLAGVTSDDHKLALDMTRAVGKVSREVRDELAQTIADAQGIGLREARRQVDGLEVQRLTDERLVGTLDPDTGRAVGGLLADVQVAPGVTLADVYVMMGDQQVSMFNRLQEGLSDAIDGGTIADWTRGDADLNMFRHRRPDELNRFQRGVNAAMSPGTVTGRWLRHKGNVAEASEQFIRGAAFIRGLRQYGAEDGGRSAALLSKGLHFDYDDLSDFERTWLRGFAIPFYTWTRNNVPLQARALMHNPGLFNRADHFHEAAQNVLGADEEGGIVPEWMQERMGFVTRFSANGSPIALGMENSAVDLNRWIKTGRPGEVAEGVGRQLVNSLSPVLKAPLETLIGVNTFTGAPHQDAGVATPAWMAALQLDHLPGMGRTDDQGQRRSPQAVVDALSNIAPPLGLFERQLFGPVAAQVTDGRVGSASGDRWTTSLLSNWLAVPVSTLTPNQQAGELRSRTQRLDRRLDWSGIDPAVREQAAEMVRRGFPPEVVASYLERVAARS